MYIIRCKFEKETHKKSRSKLSLVIISTKSCFLACLMPQPVFKAILTRFDNILIYMNKINHVKFV